MILLLKNEQRIWSIFSKWAEWHLLALEFILWSGPFRYVLRMKEKTVVVFFSFWCCIQPYWIARLRGISFSEFSWYVETATHQMASQSPLHCLFPPLTELHAPLKWRNMLSRLGNKPTAPASQHTDASLYSIMYGEPGALKSATVSKRDILLVWVSLFSWTLLHLR